MKKILMRAFAVLSSVLNGSFEAEAAPGRRSLIERLENREMLSGTMPLRIVTYNILADVYSQGLVSSPQPAMETILEAIGSESVGGRVHPIDVLALQETASNSQTVVPIVTALNSHYGAGTYNYSLFQASSSGNLDGNGPNALIYNDSTLDLISSVGIYADTAPRQPVRYQFRPAGGTSADDFYVYDSHYKSGDETQSGNGQRRQAEALAIRADEAALEASLSVAPHVLYVGDYNVYSAGELGYTAITAPGVGQALDPINSPHFHDSQTPRVTKSESASSLSSRLDLQLVTQSVLTNDGQGLYYLPGSYHVFGNDGSVSNVSQSTTALSGLPNRTTVLNDLVANSDHLPMVADYLETISDRVGPYIGTFTINPASVNVGATVTLSANSVTEYGTGSITGVSFYRESNLSNGLQTASDTFVGPGIKSGSNWTLNLATTGLSGGTCTYYAVATDSASATSDVAPASLSVSGPQTPTIGSFTASPTSGAVGITVTLNANNVTKAGGTIFNVKFYRESNGTPGLQIGSDTLLSGGTQGGNNWINSTSTAGLSAGTYSYYAVATDTSGISSTASSATVTLTAPPVPTIGSFAVTPATILLGTSSITLTAGNVTESGTGGSISSVKFYDDNQTLLGTGTQNGTAWTFNASTSGLAAGTYTYYAVATDNLAGTATKSATLSVTVPTPTIGSFTAAPATVAIGMPTTLTAGSVTESGGAGIGSVNFYRESNNTPGLQIGSDAFVAGGAQNGTTWSAVAATAGLAAGTYTCYAVATDIHAVDSLASSATFTVSASYAMIDVRAHAGPAKGVSVHSGEVVTLDVYAVVAGANQSIADDGFQTFYGSFLSTPVGGGSALGNFSLFTAASPFNTSVQGGTVQDINGLPGLDVGSLGVTTDYVYSRAGSMQAGNGTPVAGSPGTSQWLLGSLTWTVTSVPATGATTLNFLPRTGTNGATWKEDGVNRRPDSSIYTAGTDVLVTVSVLPPWLDPSSQATWDGHVLNVTGAAKIVADPGTDAPIVNDSVAGSVLTIDPSGFSSDFKFHLGGLNLSNGASVVLASVGGTRSAVNHRLLVVDANHFTMDTSSKLDLNDNDMVLRNATIDTQSLVQSLIGHAYDLSNPTGTRWDLGGITSSKAGVPENTSALGYVLNDGNQGIDAFAKFGPGTGAAQMDVLGTDVLIKYTYEGDVNLDGVINGDDYSNIDFYFGQPQHPGMVWASGDVDYNGAVDGDDYSPIDFLFNNTPVTL